MIDSGRRGKGPLARFLQDVALTFESTHGPEPRVRHVLGLLKQLMPCDHCALLNAQPGAKPRAILPHTSNNLEEGALAEGLGDLLALFFDGQDPPSQSQRRPPLKAFRVRMAVPLVGHDQVMGVLVVGRESEASPFDEEDLSIVTVAAAQIAAFLTTVRLQRENDESVATLSHELRTPLTAVLGWANLLRSGSLGQESRVRAIETIVKNAGALAQLVEDLLDLSRMEMGKVRLDQRTVNLAQVIEAAVEAARPEAERKCIVLVSVPDRTGSTVLGDAERLRQVFANLLGNAIKFTPKGGAVNLRMELEGDSVRVQISDTGRGISPEILPHIFDRFRQAAPTSRRGSDGLGLGLAIVRNLVNHHGGTVAAESDGEGKGARFIVMLPRVQGPAPEAPPIDPGKPAEPGTPESALRLSGVRVLFVDNDADTREVIRAMLEVHGANVMIAGAVPEALAIVERWKPHVLISDISMPGDDGYELMRKVTALQTKKRFPLAAAALTARSLDSDREQALAAGFRMHLTKPIEPRLLVSAVLRLAVGR